MSQPDDAILDALTHVTFPKVLCQQSQRQLSRWTVLIPTLANRCSGRW